MAEAQQGGADAPRGKATRRRTNPARQPGGTGRKGQGASRAARTRRKPTVLPPKPQLPKAGKRVLDGVGAPVFGPRHGAVELVDWSQLHEDYRRNPLVSFLRHKRWVYALASTDELLVAVAVVDAGPTGTAFCMVTDLATGETIASSTRPGGSKPLVSVNDYPMDGLQARYRLPGTEYAVWREPGSNETNVRVRLRGTGDSLPGLRWVPGLSQVPGLRSLPTASTRPWLDIDLNLESTVAPPLTAVTAVDADGGLVTSTMKSAAMNAWGTVTLHPEDPDEAPRTLQLDGGTGGLDYTNGFLPHHTAWRWAYTTGRLGDGRLFGLNLVSGFSGIGDNATENAAWLDGVLVPLSPQVRVLVDKHDLRKPWTVRTVDGSVHLRFEPLAIHRHGLNLGVMRSRFVQPTGLFTGHVIVDGERVAIERMPGVVENQDVLW